MKLLNDFSTSVIKSLNEIDPNWQSYSGLIICGTHNPHDIEEMITQIKHARENNIPFLGICMGFELMLVEWVRHKGFPLANSGEIDPQATPKVIVQLPEIRVGIRSVFWKGEESKESHWHNYAFARKHKDKFDDEWELSFTDGILEIAKLRSHPFFMGVQFHPEYQSSEDNPHWVFKQFLALCKKYDKK